ncbi:spliceosome-associated protein cwc27 [Anaeramoeba flamelloides]|uniref:Spliceosome-associated protein cwc27 n=1 Tax=Anaeramoeba flamelloides TaxID=1746091 RepID=A0AAV8ACN4_9EUKA|nr:spliceosome-associated protein cwc27 [Anaeramoeba flamelloides]
MSTIYVRTPATTGKVCLHTSGGDLDIELWTKEAPLACKNFLCHCMNGYYDNTIFHRVVKGFLIQGGDPTGTGQGGESIYEGGTFVNEIHSRIKFFHKGMVGMANTKIDQNGSQFFITLDKEESLNGKHTIFGKVTGKTRYNLDQLSEKDCDENDRPLNPDKILSIEILANPFGEIEIENQDLLRQMQEKKLKEEEEKQKEVELKKQKRIEELQNKKRRKNTKLLSFGGDDEEEVFSEIKKKSFHDHYEETKLKKDKKKKKKKKKKNKNKKKNKKKKKKKNKKTDSTIEIEKENEKETELEDVKNKDKIEIEKIEQNNSIVTENLNNNNQGNQKDKKNERLSEMKKLDQELENLDSKKLEKEKIEQLKGKASLLLDEVINLKKGEQRIQQQIEILSQPSLLQQRREKYLKKKKKISKSQKQEQVLEKLKQFKKSLSKNDSENQDWKNHKLKFKFQLDDQRNPYGEEHGIDYLVIDPKLKKK